MAGATLYLLLPKLIAVLGAWPRLSTLSPVWFTVMLAAELISFTCNFALQRLALRTRGWFAVVTAGLAGNAVTDSLPGGDAAGAAVQFAMLTTAGFDTGTAVGGLTAFSLIGIGGLLALPVFTLPAILAGVPVSQGLVRTALLGLAGFAAFAVFSVIILRADWPLAAAGRAAQRLRNRVTRGRRSPVTGLDKRLLDQRDAMRRVLGKKWWQAILLWPAYPPATPSWPSSPTGSPPTGFPSSPGCPPTCSTGTVTDGRSSGAPRQAWMASRRGARRPPRREFL